MVKYTYWDNSKEYHGAMMLEVVLSDGSTISQADEVFQSQIGKDPKKIPTIGCSWEKHSSKGIEHYLTEEEIEQCQEAWEKGTTGSVES